MKETIPKFESVSAMCSEVSGKLDKDKRAFFKDNLHVFGCYMAHLSKTLFHFVSAYKYQSEKEILIKNLELAGTEAERAKQCLYEAQHGIFSTWYSNAEPMTRTFQIDSLIERIGLLKREATKRINRQ